jgi:hypothetical protein
MIKSKNFILLIFIVSVFFISGCSSNKKSTLNENVPTEEKKEDPIIGIIEKNDANFEKYLNEIDLENHINLEQYIFADKFLAEIKKELLSKTVVAKGILKDIDFVDDKYILHIERPLIENLLKINDNDDLSGDDKSLFVKNCLIQIKIILECTPEIFEMNNLSPNTSSDYLTSNAMFIFEIADIIKLENDTENHYNLSPILLKGSCIDSKKIDEIINLSSGESLADLRISMYKTSANFLENKDINLETKSDFLVRFESELENIDKLK